MVQSSRVAHIICISLKLKVERNESNPHILPLLEVEIKYDNQMLRAGHSSSFLILLFLENDVVLSNGGLLRNTYCESELPGRITDTWEDLDLFVLIINTRCF